MSNDAETLLTPHETAERLGVSVATLDAWRVKRINLPFVKIGKLVRYKLTDIRTFIDANTKKAGVA